MISLKKLNDIGLIACQSQANGLRHLWAAQQPHTR